jgi:ASC-1-like (ASCH) protein
MKRFGGTASSKLNDLFSVYSIIKEQQYGIIAVYQESV